MGFGKWLRRGASVALAPVTGGASLAGLAPDLPGSWKRKGKELLLGQNPDDVQLPDAVQDAQKQRADLLSGLLSSKRDEAQKAVAAEGRLASERASATAQSQAAGARGFGALLARQAAQAANANAQAQIGAQTSVAAQQAAAQDVGAMQRDQALAAGLIGQSEQSALMAEQWRKANAKKGILGELVAGAGGIIGGLAGGAPGAQAGSQLGYGIGEGIEY
jgi:hypothetical protein